MGHRVCARGHSHPPSWDLRVTDEKVQRHSATHCSADGAATAWTLPGTHTASRSQKTRGREPCGLGPKGSQALSTFSAVLGGGTV